MQTAELYIVYDVNKMKLLLTTDFASTFVTTQSMRNVCNQTCFLLNYSHSFECKNTKRCSSTCSLFIVVYIYLKIIRDDGY